MARPDAIEVLEDRLGYSFRDRSLLRTALTHSSYVHDALTPGRVRRDYQSLEFLGDAVVEFLVSEHLFRRFPEKREGELSKIRATLVSRKALANRAKALGVGGFARLSRGEEKSGGRAKKAILADLFESLTAAIFLDGGMEAAATFVVSGLQQTLRSIEKDGFTHSDFKSRLQELAHRRGYEGPVYELAREEGPPHERRFLTRVSVGETTVGSGSGTSKKASEQAAARAALERIEGSAGSGQPGKEVDQKHDHNVE